MIRKNLAVDLAELNKDFARKPDSFAELIEAAPETAQTIVDREDLEWWHRFPGQPWTPPEALTEAAIGTIEDQPNIWLDAAINLMVFGQIDPPAVDNLESRARRQQALNSICNSKKFSFIREGVPVAIPEDIPQSLWRETKIRETADFVAWLRQLCVIPHQLEKPSSQSNVIAEKPTPKKRGPKDKWDWLRGRKYALGELAARGDFDDFQNQTQEWKSQADLVELVQLYLDDIGDNGEPRDTQTKEKVALWIAEFRAGARH